MTHEDEVRVLMADRMTEEAADRYLKQGAVVYEAAEFKEHFDDYLKELLNSYFGNEDDEMYLAQAEEYKNLVKSNTPPRDWSVVEVDGKTYYIMYVL